MTEVRRIVDFLRGIGIPVRLTDERVESFLPGVRITSEGLVVCEEDVKHPHDLFHEAGHLAVVPTRPWPHLDPAGTDFNAPPAAFEAAVETYMAEHPDGLTSHPEDPVCRAILQMGEAEAIAWSYAAMVAAECDLDAMWHPPFDGFDGEAPDVYVGLSLGSHPGIHGLQTVGMTTTRTYPVMSRWLSSGAAPTT